MNKIKIQLIVATGLVIVGVGLLIASFCTPPYWIIHTSVLTAFGEICTFAGALFGVDYHYKFKMHISDKEK